MTGDEADTRTQRRRALRYAFGALVLGAAAVFLATKGDWLGVGAAAVAAVLMGSLAMPLLRGPRG